MDDTEDQPTERSPDIDAVRHLNQFGTPECPLMEIACTENRSEQVRLFFKESNIPIWSENTNPLLAPDIKSDDSSPLAVKRHHGHCIRVLNDWWKAAHYIQNQYTAQYYMRILGQVVRNPESLHAWSLHVAGANIDARGVNMPKDNPSIYFDYTKGFAVPEGSNSYNKTTNVRSFSTGGVPHPQVKR